MEDFLQVLDQIVHARAGAGREIFFHIKLAEGFANGSVQGVGRGAILALPHMGNWDQAGAWLVGHGVPFTTVAERLEPAELFDRFVSFRE